jgi:hypothetical protein
MRVELKPIAPVFPWVGGAYWAASATFVVAAASIPWAWTLVSFQPAVIFGAMAGVYSLAESAWGWRSPLPRRSSWSLALGGFGFIVCALLGSQSIDTQALFGGAALFLVTCAGLVSFLVVTLWMLLRDWWWARARKNRDGEAMLCLHGAAACFVASLAWSGANETIGLSYDTPRDVCNPDIGWIAAVGYGAAAVGVALGCWLELRSCNDVDRNRGEEAVAPRLYGNGRRALRLTRAQSAWLLLALLAGAMMFAQIRRTVSLSNQARAWGSCGAHQ